MGATDGEKLGNDEGFQQKEKLLSMQLMKNAPKMIFNACSL